MVPSGPEHFFEDSPAGLRRLVLLLYGLVLPPFLGVLALQLPQGQRLGPVGLIAAICGAAAAWVTLRREPQALDWIFPVGIAPTLACGLAFAATGGQVVGYMAVVAAPLAWAAVLCDWPVLVSAWLTGVAAVLVPVGSHGGWGRGGADAVLFAVVGGLVAWAVHGKTAHHRQARLRSLEKQLDDIELLARADGVIVDANDRAAEAYRCPRGLLLRLRMQDLGPPAERALVEEQLQAVERAGGAVFEAEHVRKDGSRFPVEVSARAYRIRGRRYVHSVVRDVSARRAAEAQRRFVATLLAELGEAVVVLDETFRIQIWSPGAERIFGWEEAEAVGQSPFGLLVPREAEAATAWALTRAAAGKRCTELVRWRRKDGQRLAASVGLVALQHGTGAITGVMVVARDVTEQQAAEAALREGEKRLAASLAEARRACEVRERILAVVAHDLRNPLAAILSTAAEVAELGAGPGAPAELGECAELIRGAAARMGRLIEDRLDVAAIEKGSLRLAPERNDCAAIAADAARGAEPLLRSGGLSLSLEVKPGPVEARCDRGRILQVLGNLLANACHATPAGGTVTLRLSEEEGGDLHFTVCDTGRGLEEGAIERIFQPHQRGKTSFHKGAGLGLAIARGIVEGHGGRIWAERVPEGGAAFHFLLPGDRPVAVRVAAGAASAA